MKDFASQWKASILGARQSSARRGLRSPSRLAAVLPVIFLTVQAFVCDSSAYPTALPGFQMAVSTLRPDTWYRFTLPQRPGYALDIINDGHAHEDGKLQIAPTGDYSGQLWQLIPSLSGQYRMRTMYTGPDMYLTVRSEDNIDPHLTAESRKSRRLWHIVPCSNDTVKIKLNVSGRDYYLGSKYDANWFRLHRPVLSNQEDETQIWKTETVRSIEEPIFDAGRYDMGW